MKRVFSKISRGLLSTELEAQVALKICLLKVTAGQNFH